MDMWKELPKFLRSGVDTKNLDDVLLRVWEMQRVLPWDSGFALKPYQGSRMQNVYLWKASSSTGKGIASRVAITKAILDGRVAYWQEWIEPEWFYPTGNFMIRRVYFGWHPEKHCWNCFGGFSVILDNYRIHGTSESLFCVILPP